MRILIADPRRQQARHDRADPQWLRGVEEAGAADAGIGRRDGVLRAVGARSRQRSRVDAHPRPRRRRRLGAQRLQVLDHQRRQVNLVHGDGGDRSGQGRQRHLGVHRPQGRRGLHASAPRSASSASRAHRPPNCISRTAAFPATASSASRAAVSRPRWPASTTPDRRSARRPSASRRAPWTRRSHTPRNASSSAGR